ncbi:replication initiation protein [Spirosoma endophyticum]|uniref:Protein involved in initiation of plasmid replication n=1 Tax=Spirosoma endophyticum TaxID=662367 RepID=A0A1I2I1S1_9BACT|nr:replication initiation protein [Spirosoma endophyticum]SFF35618.1 Protein involved in initiation of plasmid replication [Spirosoma endophyticum]
MRQPVEIWQDNVLTNARYEMTEAEKNILYMVVASVRAEDSPTKMYQVSVKEMAKVCGSKELMLEAYKQATEKLIGRVFTTTLENGDILQASFIASALYKKGTGIIEIELSQKVRPYYVDLHKKYTKIQLAAAISLNSAYAKRIYEVLCMYKNMPDKSFRRDLLDLKKMLGVVNIKTGKDKYPIWTQFKRDVIDVAAREINGHTDLTFNFKPIYGDRPGRGRKPVVEVEFEVFYQAKTEPAPLSNLHERLVKQFRLRPDQADQVLATQTVETINRQLYDIQTKANDGKVKNLGSYTAKVFGLETNKKEK